MRIHHLFRWTAAGAVVAVPCLFLAPLHTLSHEFSIVFTLWNCILFFFCAFRAARNGEDPTSVDSMGRSRTQSMWAASVSAITGLLILAVANIFIFNCTISTGLLYFFVTWAPAIFWMTALGAAVGAMGLRTRTACSLLAGIAVVCVVHDGLQLYFGPRILPVDPLLGDLAGFSQRISMKPSPIHIRHAYVLVLASLFLSSSARAFLRRKRVDSVPANYGEPLGLGLVLIILVTFFGSYAGIGLDRSALHRACPVEIETAHFEIHCSEDGAALSVLDALARDAEWEWREITDLWEIDPESKVVLYVFATSEEIAEHTGLPFAHAGLGEIYLDIESGFERVLRHELVHALHYELKPSPLVLLSRGLLEGTAVAFEAPYSVLPETHEFQAAALQSNKLPAAKSLFSVMAFGKLSEGPAYLASGSFLGFLVHAYGMAPFKAYQKSLDFSEAYNKSVETLDGEWREFLKGVPARSDVQVQASRYFDPTENPGYYSARCPKVGEHEDEQIAEARRLYGRGHYRAAAPIYEALYGEHKALEWAHHGARSYDQSEQYGKALALIQKASAEPDLQDFQKAALMAGRVRVQIKERDWEGLYETYDERSRMDVGLGTGNRMGEQCLRHPEIRHAYAELVFEENETERGRLWADLRRKHPDFEPLIYLYATSTTLQKMSITHRSQVLLHAAHVSQEMADLVAPEIHRLYKEAVHERAYDIAGKACQTMARVCSKPQYQYEGEVGLRRIAYEQGL